MRQYTWLCLICVFLLTGCISREQADEKLARGCAAGIELFQEEGFKIGKIKDKIFRDHPELGKGHREVRLMILETDGWYEADKEYSCIFTESFGFAGNGHSATIYQLKMDDRIYGKDHETNKIISTFDEQLKLTETVEQGMMGIGR